MMNNWFNGMAATGKMGVPIGCRWVSGVSELDNVAAEEADSDGKAQAFEGDDKLVTWVTYTHLPDSNGGFGERPVRLELYDESGAAIQAVQGKFEVFLQRDAKDHPGDGSGTTPNWYYYWSGTAIPVHYLNDPLFEFDGDLPGFGRFDKDRNKIKLGPRAPDTWHYAARSRYNGGFEFTMDASGFDNVYATLIHEGEHANIYAVWKPGGIWAGKSDFDHDQIPDDIEMRTRGFNWRLKISFACSPGTPGDDEEIWCELQSLDRKGGDPKQDWANPGSLHGKPH